MKYRKIARPLALTVASLLALQPVSALAVTFADINQVPWPGAEVSINKAADLGLVVGETKNGKSYFRPKDTVSLSESCQFVYKVMLQTKKATASSTVTEKWAAVLDTYKIQDWADPAVSYCLENGIISIADLSSFVKNGVNMPASREQAAEMMGRALKVGVPSLSANASSTSFKDNASISADAIPYIALLNAEKIVNGDDVGNFNPKKTLNRTETAVMITNLYSKLNAAPAVVDPSITSTVSGKITDMNSLYVNLDNSAAYYRYSADGATVTLNGSTSSIDALVTLFKDGTEITAVLTLDGNPRITKIAATSDVEEEESGKLTKGELTKVTYDDEDDDGTITIEKTSTYRVNDDDVSIEILEEDADDDDDYTDYDISDLYDLFKDLDDDQVIEVELKFDRNNDLYKIIGEVKDSGSSGKEDGDVEGDVDDVDYDEDDEKGTIEVDGDTYDFDEDTDIEIDGDRADWEDLLDAFEDAEDNDETLEAVLILDKDEEYAEEIFIYTEDYDKDDDNKNEDEEYEGEIEDMSYDYDDEEGEIEVDGETLDVTNPDDVDVDVQDGDDDIDNFEDLYAAFEFGKTMEVEVIVEDGDVVEITGRVTKVAGLLTNYDDDYLKVTFEAELDDEDVEESNSYYFTEYDKNDEDEEEDWEDELKDIEVSISNVRNVDNMYEFYDWLDGKDLGDDDDEVEIRIELELDDDGMITNVSGKRK